MWEFIRAGGPVMYFLLVTSIVAVAFIIERAFALRWKRVIPAVVEDAAEKARTKEDVARMVQVAKMNPSPMSRLLLLAHEHLDWTKQENIDSIETKARHEVMGLERGLVILEIVVGIAPLTGLVGTLHGLIAMFGNLGNVAVADNAALAKGISIALNTTLMGLIVAIPALIAWSFYNRKVESLAIEMESICDLFLRQQYREASKS